MTTKINMPERAELPGYALESPPRSNTHKNTVHRLYSSPISFSSSPSSSSSSSHRENILGSDHHHHHHHHHHLHRSSAAATVGNNLPPNLPPNGYKLQRSAYVHKRDGGPFRDREMDSRLQYLYNHGISHETYRSVLAEHRRAMSSRERSLLKNVRQKLDDLSSRDGVTRSTLTSSKSNFCLPNIVISGASEEQHCGKIHRDDADDSNYNAMMTSSTHAFLNVPNSSRLTPNKNVLSPSGSRGGSASSTRSAAAATKSPPHATTPRFEIQTPTFRIISPQPSSPRPQSTPAEKAPAHSATLSVPKANRRASYEDIQGAFSSTKLAPSVSKLSPAHRNSSRRSSAASTTTTTTRHSRKGSHSEHNHGDLAMKMSLPCKAGCCYCVYATLLGPVKVYFTRAEKPKKGPFLGNIKDGHGRPVIPVSRKSDIRGLVYDKESHSLHPPARGQRPLFRQNSPADKKKSAGTAKQRR